MMKAKKGGHLLNTKKADNIELNALLKQLSGFGLSQQKAASIIGISPSQLSRIKKGERPATWKHIRSLRNRLQMIRLASKQEDKITVFRSSIFSIDQAILKGLSALMAVECFRNLLWSRASQLGISVTNISITSEIYTPDGGVDASILAGANVQDDLLLSSGRRFQIKTGNFQPWKPATIKKELFGSKAQKLQNLGEAIQQALRAGQEIVYVCFGVDPSDVNLRKAQENFASAFRKCGFSYARVSVWGQTHLLGLINQYPSLCLSLRGLDHQGFQFWSSWAGNADMQPRVHYSPETHQLLEVLRGDLQTGQFPHVRLIGEPGIGKTRFALEVTRTPSLAPLTLYLRDGQTLLKSSFLHELIQGDLNWFVVLVIDECPPKDSAEIWNVLKTRSNRIRIITIDHSPDGSIDDKRRLVEVKPADPDQIASILKEYGLNQFEADRWANYCQGCPRVAHVIGENLRQNNGDIVQSPANVDVWERFIVGRDDPGSEEVQLRRIVLCLVSLFERFGFEHPVSQEAQFIAALASKCDQRLTWQRFQSLIAKLKERRIIQGTTTLYITPRLLHVYLYREYWRLHGASTDLAEMLKEMPKQLQRWFVGMLKYAHLADRAQAAVIRLLGPDGLFPNGCFTDDQEKAQLLEVIAETAAKPTLKCLERTIGNMEISQLKELRASRQYLVWTLGKLAVWENCFMGSAELLLKLAESENATNSNNATGTFTELFSLVPGMAATQAAPLLRFSLLKEELQSDSSTRRQIALAAAKTALSNQGGGRIIGPEHQGLRQTIKFWFPKTYGELWDAQKAVWDMLVEKLRIWSGEERIALIRVIIASAHSILHVQDFSPKVLYTIEALVGDADSDVKEMLNFINIELKYRVADLDKITVDRLLSIRTKLDGYDFKSKLLRYVKYATTEDAFDDNYQRTNILELKLDALAREAINDPTLLMPELKWLLCEDLNNVFALAMRLGEHDTSRKLWPAFVKEQESLTANSRLTFLAGYLASVNNHNPVEWESMILPLADVTIFQSRFADLAISSGMSDAVARKVIDLCKKGAVESGSLSRWWFASRVRQIEESVFLELIELQLEGQRYELWNNALHMYHNYYLDKDTKLTLPNEATFRVLTFPAMADLNHIDGSTVFSWARLAKAYLQKYSTRVWELFRALLRLGARQMFLLDNLETTQERILTNLVKNDPDLAWDCVVKTLHEIKLEKSYGIQRFLREGGHHISESNVPGPIMYVSPKLIFAWVDKDLEQHGRWIIQVLPKTLDKSSGGRLTRDFIAKYGKDERLCNSLLCHFGSRSYWGSASATYRKLREEGSEWLEGERNHVVIRWIENYLDSLSNDIRRAEIEEERRF